MKNQECIIIRRECECDFWQKCDRNLKPLLGHHLKALFMLITMAQSPASYLIHIPIPSATFSSKIESEGLSLTSVIIILLSVHAVEACERPHQQLGAVGGDPGAGGLVVNADLPPARHKLSQVQLWL